MFLFFNFFVIFISILSEVLDQIWGSFFESRDIFVIFFLWAFFRCARGLVSDLYRLVLFVNIVTSFLVLNRFEEWVFFLLDVYKLVAFILKSFKISILLLTRTQGNSIALFGLFSCIHKKFIKIKKFVKNFIFHS